MTTGFMVLACTLVEVEVEVREAWCTMEVVGEEGGNLTKETNLDNEKNSPDFAVLLMQFMIFPHVGIQEGLVSENVSTNGADVDVDCLVACKLRDSFAKPRTYWAPQPILQRDWIKGKSGLLAWIHIRNCQNYPY